MKAKLVALVLSIALASSPLYGIFGIGVVVFDPSAYAQMIEQLAQMQQEYAQLVQTYTMITRQYNQMLTNAKWITSKARWRAAITAWSYPAASDTYGTTHGWIAAVNSGAASLDGYLKAAAKLQNYGSIWASLDNEQQDSISRNYASVELSDGATVNGIEQLGRLRANTSAVDNAISSLELDSLSDTAEMNTEVGVLNKINAANVIGIRNSQDNNKLLAALLDHQLVEAKTRRDAQAQSFNNDVALRKLAPAVAAQHLSGTTAVLTTYRLP